jgi:hypothetical protein
LEEISKLEENNLIDIARIFEISGVLNFEISSKFELTPHRLTLNTGTVGVGIILGVVALVILVVLLICCLSSKLWEAVLGRLWRFFCRLSLWFWGWLKKEYHEYFEESEDEEIQVHHRVLHQNAVQDANGKDAGTRQGDQEPGSDPGSSGKQENVKQQQENAKQQQENGELQQNSSTVNSNTVNSNTKGKQVEGKQVDGQSWQTSDGQKLKNKKKLRDTKSLLGKARKTLVVSFWRLLSAMVDMYSAAKNERDLIPKWILLE